jgi:hypothetical protein
VFAVGLIAAILASSLISVLATTHLGLIQGPKGEKGDKGDTGATGPAFTLPFAESEGNLLEYSSNIASWTDIASTTAVSINVTKNSVLLILFSAEGRSSQSDTRINLRAVYNSSVALPVAINFFPGANNNVYSAFSYTFWSDAVGPGIYMVKMQWNILIGGTGYLRSPIIIVIALPA